MKKAKHITSKGTIILAAIALLLILLLLKFCTTPDSSTSPLPDAVGSSAVSDSRWELQESEKDRSPVQEITFFGCGKYFASLTQPYIELYNPKQNSVDMIFTLSDRKTEELIARTDAVPPGSYAYIDVVEFYRARGTYIVDIDISTADAITGNRLNGMHQQAEVIIN